MWQKCTGQVRYTDHWQVLAAFEGVSQVRISQGCLASAHPKNPCCPVDILAQEPGWVDAFPQQSGWEAVVLANVVSCYLWNLLAAISLLTSLCCCFFLTYATGPLSVCCGEAEENLSWGSNVRISALSSNVLRCDLVWFKLRTLRPDSFMDLTFEDDFWEHLGESIRWPAACPSMSVLFHWILCTPSS